MQSIFLPLIVYFIGVDLIYFQITWGASMRRTSPSFYLQSLVSPKHLEQLFDSSTKYLENKEKDIARVLLIRYSDLGSPKLMLNGAKYFSTPDQNAGILRISLRQPFRPDKEDCYLTSVLSTLKNEQPIIIVTDNNMKIEQNESNCKQKHCNKDDDCYGYIYNSSGKECFTYKYNDKATGNSPSTELTHKAIFIYNNGLYPESNPKPLNDWCPEMTEEVVKQKIEKIKETLLVKKKETNRYNRTLISAPDPRQSAKNLGLVGVTVICVVVAIIILPDYINLYRECQSKTKRHRD